MAKKQSPKDKIPVEPAPLAANFPIVGIGASAGGLEAFEQFFAHMPANAGIAFVLVQHLDPTRKSMLVELIQRFTRMPVYQVEDNMPIDPNCIYIIPPNRDMKLENRRLRLLEPTGPRGLRLAIDFFFRSLAAEQKEQAIGIVLSGTGSDGTLGIQTIKGEGGMVMVQSPNSARYDGMPTNAIATELADFVLPPEQMPIYLINFIKRPPPVVINPNEPVRPEVMDAMKHVFVLLQTQTGHDFSLYKDNTIGRRIERRMVINQFDKIADYIDYLRRNPPEIDALFKELLISVTSFFRDAEAFEILEHQVIPELLPEALTTASVRVWVPGCATGEEAYSIAILMQERLERLGRQTEVQIFATDIDLEAIERARLGVYPGSIIGDVSPDRLGRFFKQEGSSYRVKKLIREMMIFSVQNVLQDPPFSRIDLISCRNLLIYFRPILQKRVFPIFHYALKPNGFLFLGSSESPGEYAPLFSLVNKRWKIFQRDPGRVIDHSLHDFAMAGLITLPGRKNRPSQKPLRPRQLVEKFLLEAHTPACVVIDELGTIQYIHGRTGHLLEPPAGEANWNITRMARPGLQIPLATAIRRAQSQQQTITYDQIKIPANGDEIVINLKVKPVSEPGAMAGLLLVIFEEVGPGALTLDEAGKGGPAQTDYQRIADLEHELKSTREYLHTTVEELETSNEELTATNEELQSANEELQSTNEELQTAKEELQSVNEELVTVNTELEAKVDELSSVNNDMNNMFAGIDVGAIVTDMGLFIRRFTPAASRVAKLIETDVGRPLSHIVCNLLEVDLAETAAAVLDTLKAQEREVQHKNGSWYWMRVRPYRTEKNAVEGVTFTFSHVTKLKQAQQERETAFQNRPMGIILEELGIGYYEHAIPLDNTTYHSPEWAAILGYTLAELPPAKDRLGWVLAQVHPEDRAGLEQAYIDFIEGRSPIYDVGVRIKHKSEQWLAIRGISRALERDKAGRVVRLLGIMQLLDKPSH
ncbi:MAG: PAS domain-containing protein [Anaerolineales bacterium]|nr:PAS domain-containing protein [Anaerolineales bacterium]